MREKTIAAYEARRQFGRMLREVETKDESFIVERHGEPVAVVVSLEMYKLAQKEMAEKEERKRNMEIFFEYVEKAQANWEKNAPDMTEEEIMELALEAQAWARAEMRAGR